MCLIFGDLISLKAEASLKIIRGQVPGHLLKVNVFVPEQGAQKITADMIPMF